MAEYTVPLGTTTINGSTNYSFVNPGDTLILAPGTRGDMSIENLTGTAANPITIKNGNGKCVINAALNWLGFEITDSEYLHITGTGKAGLEYGIQITNWTNAGYWIHTLARNIETDHLEIGPSSDPILGVSERGITVSTLAADAPPGWTQDNIHLHHLYVHDTRTEGAYIGKDTVPNMPVYIVNLEVNDCIFQDCGAGAIQIRMSHEVLCHDNDIRDCGWLNDAFHAGHSLNAGEGVYNADYYDNFVLNGNVGFYGLYHSTGVRVFQNVMAHCGWYGQGVRGGIKIATQGNGISIYNNTIVEANNYAIDTKSGDATGSPIRSNLIAETTGTDIDSDYTVQDNCIYDTVEEVAFVDPDNHIYQLLAESPARASGYGGADCGAFQYTGVYGRTQSFPSAQGAGAFAQGGRGTTIYKVTTLADSGAGSFREACEASGSRIVVFFVGGYIDLASEINVTNPYLSIYGQTAPGHGITLRYNRFRIQTHDVVCRYLRFAPGPNVANPENMQALLIQYGSDAPADPNRVPHDIMFDHCTFRWATDANVRILNSNWNLYNPALNTGVSRIERVTFQWCFFYECFDDVGSTNHSYNFVVEGGCTNISLHHNLFASCRSRNPAIRGGTVEVVNNILFNCVIGTRFGGPTDQDGLEPAYVNYVSNWEIHGNDSFGNHMCVFSVNASACADPANEKEHQIYPLGNRGRFKLWPAGPEWDIMGCSTGNQDADTRWQVGTAHVIIGGRPVTVLSLPDMYTAILAHGGCKMPLCFGRDKADRRIVQAVKSHGGSIPSSTMAEVGGWPTLSPGYPLPADPDNDGVWSWFETANGSNPAVADADSYDYDGGGAYEQPYMNIEVFTNVHSHMDPHVLVAVDVN